MWTFLSVTVACVLWAACWGWLGYCGWSWGRGYLVLLRERVDHLNTYNRLWESNVQTLKDMDAAHERRFRNLEAGRLEALTGRGPPLRRPE